ncbi:hypothetical protein DMA11_17675 [Marinilabiliaceae bacterium JC017]|nr:hypothetical protein DMA11_17675 [Marinilabiliaceae bacterium JC017]
MSNVVKVYAFITKNENLANFLVCSENKLSNQMRHQELLDYAASLSERIAPIIHEMNDYGLTSEMETKLKAETSAFKKIITEPRQLISERKTFNETIENLLNLQFFVKNNIILTYFSHNSCIQKVFLLCCGLSREFLVLQF